MITRERLSSDVHQEVLNRIVRGEIAPGQRLRDTELADELGVSRTPVREALLRLEREGFIVAQKHLGFSVSGLAASDIREIYPLVRVLECAALETAPCPGEARAAELRELGRALRLEGSAPLRRIELDSAWHEALVGASGNGHLRRVLADLKRILLRYEYSFMMDEALVAASAAEHEAIAEAMARGDRAEAARLLGAHWERCTQATLAGFLAGEAAS